MTTPIFYVNGPPHLGHLYTALLADALTRTHRLLSRPTHLITGTDEHGNKVKHAATVHSTSPLAFATAQSARYRALFDAAAVSYSTYMRTTDAHHQRVVQHVWQRMEASGDIYLGRHEGWYCTAEEAFIPLNQTEERQRKGEVVRVNSANGLPVEWQSEENFMFRLSKYQQPLLDWLTSSPTSPVQPPSRRPEVLTLLSAPLADLSVSRLRSNADWGIPVPSHPSHTIYVWFDALLNYLSACIDPSSLPSSTTPSPPLPPYPPLPYGPPPCRWWVRTSSASTPSTGPPSSSPSPSPSPTFCSRTATGRWTAVRCPRASATSSTPPQPSPTWARTRCAGRSSPPPPTPTTVTGRSGT